MGWGTGWRGAVSQHPLTYIVDRQIQIELSKQDLSTEGIRVQLHRLRPLMMAIIKSTGKDIGHREFVFARIRSMQKTGRVARTPYGMWGHASGKPSWNYRVDAREGVELSIFELLESCPMSTIEICEHIRRDALMHRLTKSLMAASRDGVAFDRCIKRRLDDLTNRKLIRSQKKLWSIRAKYDGICSFEDYRNPDQMALEIGVWARNWSSDRGSEIRGDVDVYRPRSYYGKIDRSSVVDRLERPGGVSSDGASKVEGYVSDGVSSTLH